MFITCLWYWKGFSQQQAVSSYTSGESNVVLRFQLCGVVPVPLCSGSVAVSPCGTKAGLSLRSGREGVSSWGRAVTSCLVGSPRLPWALLLSSTEATAWAGTAWLIHSPRKWAMWGPQHYRRFEPREVTPGSASKSASSPPQRESHVAGKLSPAATPVGFLAVSTLVSPSSSRFPPCDHRACHRLCKLCRASWSSVHTDTRWQKDFLSQS